MIKKQAFSVKSAEGGAKQFNRAIKTKNGPLDFQFWGITSIGERGQIVVPIKARQYLSLKKGDKLIAFSKGKEFIGFMKSDDMYKMFKQIFGQLEESDLIEKK